MPNNFKLQGDYYVSKAGNDSNDGLTPETPLLTVQAALDKITSLTTSKTIVVGSGVYKQTLSKTITTSTLPIITIVGDGVVAIEATNGTQSHLFNSSNNTFTYSFNNIEFRNAKSFELGFFGLTGAICSIVFNNCRILINIVWVSNSSSYNYFVNCQFINSIHSFPGQSTGALPVLSYDKCIFINSSQDAWELNPGGVTYKYNMTTVFKNCYTDSNSLIRMKSDANSITGVNAGQTIATGNVINNNIQGKIVFPWTGSVSGINTWNVPISLAQAKIDYPTYFFNSISADPKFNDPLDLNFTLQSDSPHIKAASDYTNIGGTEYAVYKSSTSTELTSGATISGLTLRGNNSYTITSSPTAGTLETAPIFLQWPATKPLTKLEWAGSLEFNKSITAGTFGNNNVPDWDTYTTGAGASPDRLTVKMRFSTQQTEPTLSSHWDNGGYWTAGNYELFEVNSKPKVDSNGKGNGNPDYIESLGLGDIVPTWIQINVKLIDTYNP